MVQDKLFKVTFGFKAEDHSELSAMLHFIQILTNQSDVTMQVKRDIVNNIFAKQPIHYECTCLCPHGMICCLFFKCNKALLHGFDPYMTFYLRCKYSTFLVGRTHRNAMKGSIEILLLYVQKEETFMNSLQL